MIEKIDGKSLNIIDNNLEKLKEIYPEAFTEGKVDPEKLLALLGENVDNSNEKYSFSWNGKNDCIRLAQTPSTGTLLPCKEDSVDWDTTGNLYIEGDNLEVLKLLQKSYLGKVKMIYIDPPYNTGNDFVYEDDFADNIANYKEITGQASRSNAETEGRYHTKWLNMIMPRLKLARTILAKDGVIFISIDDHEYANLKKVCDEVFGENNFVGNIIWQTATDNNPSQISTEHEYILCYAKKIEMQPKWMVKSQKAQLIQNKYEEIRKNTSDCEQIKKELQNWIKKNEDRLSGVKHYSSIDEFGVYYPGNSSNTRDGGYTFDIIHPITKNICKRPAFGYRWTEETFLEAATNGDVEWGKDENTIPKIKKRISTVTEMLKSYYYEDNRAWTSYLSRIMGKKVFDNPKSVNLLQRLIKFTTRDNDLIVDFFSGSASTAEAVFRQNIEDEGNRRFIMVQLPESLDKNLEVADSKAKPIIINAINFLDSIFKPHTISELGKERIRRVGQLLYKESGKVGDYGFRAFKLDHSNLVKWDNSPTEDVNVIADRIQQSLFYLNEGRTNMDFVYEIMLKFGMPLTETVNVEKIGEAEAYGIINGSHSILICLNTNIRINDIEKMAETKYNTLIFADKCFDDANMLINAEEILKKNNKQMRLF